VWDRNRIGSDVIMSLKEIGVYAGIGIIVLMVITAGIGTTIINPGEKGVRVNNGEVVGTMDNGVHMINPVTTNVHRFESRTSVYNKSASALTADDVNAEITVTVRWDIKDGEYENIYQNTAINQEALRKNAVRDAVISGIKTSRQYEAKNLSSKEYSQSVKAEIEDRFANRGLIVRSVTIENIEYPPSVAKKFREQQEAEAQKKIAQNELEQSRIEAKKNLVEARNKREVIQTRTESLTPLYVDYIEAKNIDKSDTVYVVPDKQSPQIEQTIEANSNSSAAGT